MRSAQAWLARLNASPHALWLLASMSFLETIIVPIPLEVVLVPFLAANRHRAWTIAAVTTAGCLVASLVGYGVGYYLYESAGTWLIETLGIADAYSRFQAFFDQRGFLAVLTVGILPIPFQVAMIAAGLSGYPIYLFVFAALIARGLRYFGLAWLVLRFGDRARAIWQRHALLSMVGAGAAVVGLMLLARYLAGAVM